MAKNLTLFLLIVLVAAGVYYLGTKQTKEKEAIQVTSTPEQSKSDASEKSDKIILAEPRPNELVKSPLKVSGMARGNWYFEAQFPIVLVDGDGKTIATQVAKAKGDWMTEDFVPFSATITFTNPASASGVLILKKDNPSGLPQNDDELRIPVKFE